MEEGWAERRVKGKESGREEKKEAAVGMQNKETNENWLLSESYRIRKT